MNVFPRHLSQSEPYVKQVGAIENILEVTHDDLSFGEVFLPVNEFWLSALWRS